MKENNSDNQMIKSISEIVLRKVKDEYDNGNNQVDAVMNVAGTLIIHTINTMIEVHGKEAAQKAFQHHIEIMEKMIFDGEKQ